MIAKDENLRSWGPRFILFINLFEILIFILDYNLKCVIRLRLSLFVVMLIWYADSTFDADLGIFNIKKGSQVRRILKLIMFVNFPNLLSFLISREWLLLLVWLDFFSSIGLWSELQIIYWVCVSKLRSSDIRLKMIVSTRVNSLK